MNPRLDPRLDLSLSLHTAPTLSTHAHITSPTVLARSPALLNPLLSPEMRAHPAWKCWLKLVEFFALMFKHELAVSDIETLDDLQLEHSRLFDQVPEYTGMKRPKHHFMAHVPGDVWRYGPPRGYWCFGFEAFNKVIKAGAQLSNWKCSSLSIMKYWSMKSACRLRK